MAGKRLVLDLLDPWWTPAALVGLAGTVGLLAGAYPALVLSGFSPVRVLKGSASAGPWRSRLREGLIVAQFGISILLLVATLIVSGQLDYLQRMNLGFDAGRVLVLAAGNNGKLHQHFAAVEKELKRIPAVRAVTPSTQIPGTDAIGDTGFAPEGRPDADSLVAMGHIVIYPSFLETYGLEVVQGRWFHAQGPADWEDAYVINEAAARALGWKDPIGKRLRLWGMQGQVVGVVKDFHFNSARDEVGPLVLDLANGFNYLSVRLETDDLPGTLAAVQTAWQRALPGEPFEYFFVDDAFDRLYRQEVTLRRVFVLFSFLALFVACLGLFGLAAYTVERRRKEVGIRKVVGATARDVVVLLTREFALLVVVAFVVAAPVGYLAMNEWLSDFAYQVPLVPGVFLLAGGVALLVALGTVGWQALKAALANPVESLRYE